MERKMINELRDNINHVFVGKEKIVDYILICLIAGGHVLLEDVPGVGKTTLALTLAKSIHSDFGRIQFTPDTLPSDVTGVSVYNMKEEKFVFQPGPVMNQILLGDEINRTSPKTQSCLLEAMAERQITVDGTVYKLPEPFMVIATQNPVEFMGTYPLLEAQMDRFMMRLSLGYPEREQEMRMAGLFLEGKTPDKLSAVCEAQDIMTMQKEVAAITVKENVIGYMEDIVVKTREEKRYLVGASPRALLALIRASQGKAYLEGRDYVKPDDVKYVVRPVLAHRFTLSSEAKVQREDATKILDQILTKVRVPD